MTKSQTHKIKMNRVPLDNSIFTIRKEDVKWPTIRKGWLTDDNVTKLRSHMITVGRSIIFLDGMYNTNLNRWVGKSPEERAVFFEYMINPPQVSGAIFALCWIGNFHNGSIFHCAWQYPQIRCWHENSKGAETYFEHQAFYIYQSCVKIIYGEDTWDHEVFEFIEQEQEQRIGVSNAKTG